MTSERLMLVYSYPIKVILSFSLIILISCTENDKSDHTFDMGQSKEDGDSWWYLDRFEDHTITSLASLASYEEYALHTPEMSVLKFWITEPEVGVAHGWSELAMLRFYDSAFYELHDQVYWFRLLNGAKVWGFDIEPHDPPLEAETIDEVISLMDQADHDGEELPLNLRFTSSRRLYAPDFYDGVLDQPRRSIVGSLLHIQPKEGRIIPEDIWAIELEYSDLPTTDEMISLLSFFDRRLPIDMPPVYWLTRSGYQNDIAEQMIMLDPSLADRVLNYSDLVVPGEAQVYSEGMTAGRVHLMEDVHEATKESELLIFQELPDDLPACRGLITTLPQTPLAHLNLLARNRGIPNLYVADFASSPALTQLSRARAPALLWAQAPGQWRVLPLESDEYSRYLRLQAKPEREITRPSISDSPYWVEYEEQSIEELLQLRPYIGGKASGLFIIHDQLKTNSTPQDLVSPQPLLALTGRAYAEHLEPLESLIKPILQEPSVKGHNNLLILILEGRLGVQVRHLNERDRNEAERWLNTQSQEIRTMVNLGGVQGWIRAQDLAADTYLLLKEKLESHFVSLSPYQGLRFRSSSNVEDLEGFNGAGLYTSFTGYLYPHVQSKASEQAKNFPKALKEVWASYWNLEAFEERELEGIDHFRGWMGTVIHPQFQAEHELSNGVMTLTLLPQKPSLRGHLWPQSPEGLSDHTEVEKKVLARATLNSQIGEESVTNPSSPNILTELIEVKVFEDLQLEINHLQRSTISDEVLTNTEVESLVQKTFQLTQNWLLAEQKNLERSQQFQAFTLDFEYRGVSATWPLTRQVSTRQSPRMILKQARPLEPAHRNLSAELQQSYIPKDILRRSRRIRRWHCTHDDITVSALQVYTDPLSKPKMGFEFQPFTAEIIYQDHRSEARNSGRAYRLTHLDFLVLNSSTYESEQRNHWTLSAYRRSSRNLPFEYLMIDQKTRQIKWIPRSSEEEVLDQVQRSLSCRVDILFASPNDFLQGILQQAFEADRGFGSEPEL